MSEEIPLKVGGPLDVKDFNFKEIMESPWFREPKQRGSWELPVWVVQQQKGV